MSKTNNSTKMKWYTMDLHLHTPASADYLQPEVSYLDILKQAAKRGLDMIAFTDHNTVAGYRRMMDEVEQLKLLQQLNRLLPEEEKRLNDYEKLINRVVVFPGFEFTATFGFHILAIFPQDKSLRDIEHLLLEMNIPSDKLDEGSVTVGASVDVLTAYRLIDEAGGMAIAAHANSTNGIAMRRFPFGGQTKIAYTQDPHLMALEVTDLEKKGRYSTASFFSGNKPEYPRRMHCIQGSDAHLMIKDPKYQHKLGVGDRTTDVRLPERSFAAIRQLFESNNFSRTRPHRYGSQPAYDFIQDARNEGATFVQDFHEKMTVRGGHLYSIIADICAFANSNGGTLYLGLSDDTSEEVQGISRPSQSIAKLKDEISKRISPELECKFETQKTQNKNVIQVMVPKGEDPPFAVDDNKVYLRAETETGMAVRDEIVELVLQGQKQRKETVEAPVKGSPLPIPGSKDVYKMVSDEQEPEDPPRTGVEIVSVTKRGGEQYYTVRDLRNGNVVKNVTLKSSRRLWHYAISQYAKLPNVPSQIDAQWQGDLGLMNTKKRGKYRSYDLIQRTPDGYQYYYGVTDDGVHGKWEAVVQQG
ncbi:MAG: putative DNA binding domain-containing protein [Anaerolineales bacterium]|nr:putative DNA binding domain-containing protein [Anaerolineales bacterium]